MFLFQTSYETQSATAVPSLHWTERRHCTVSKHAAYESAEKYPIRLRRGQRQWSASISARQTDSAQSWTIVLRRLSPHNAKGKRWFLPQNASGLSKTDSKVLAKGERWILLQHVSGFSTTDCKILPGLIASFGMLTMCHDWGEARRRSSDVQTFLNNWTPCAPLLPLELKI